MGVAQARPGESPHSHTHLVEERSPGALLLPSLVAPGHRNPLGRVCLGQAPQPTASPVSRVRQNVTSGGELASAVCMTWPISGWAPLVRAAALWMGRAWYISALVWLA